MFWTRCFVLMISLAAPLWAQNSVKVGDRVEYRPMYGAKGTIVEIGTGENLGSFLIRYDSGGQPLWVRTYGQRGSLFVIGPDGQRLFDVVDAAPMKRTVLAPTTTPSSPRVTPGAAAPAPSPTAAATTPAVPGTVKGRALFANGQGIPSFTVTIAGHKGTFNPFATPGTSEHLAEAKGNNGSYSTPVPSAAVNQVSAIGHITYNGQRFDLPLHPVDDKPTFPAQGAFLGDSTKGVVRDFKLRISGLKPDYQDMNPKESTSNDSDNATQAFYGATVELTDNFVVNAPAGATLTLTLTPTGPLLDGSAGTTITRSLPVESRYQLKFYFRNIPIGPYNATAQLTEPGGTVVPLKLGAFGRFTPSAAVEFAPNTTLGGIQRVRLDLSR